MHSNSAVSGLVYSMFLGVPAFLQICWVYTSQVPNCPCQCFTRRWASGATRSSNVGSLIKTQQQQQHAAPPATTSHGADMSKVDNADVAVTDVDVSSASVGSAGGAEGQQHQDLHPALQQPFGANTSGRA